VSGAAHASGVDSTGIISAVVAAGPGARAAIRRSLASAEVQAAELYGDVESAIAAVRRVNPQLCVLDRDLPGAGLSAIAALTSPRRPPRLVVVGGRVTRTEARAVRLAGAAAWLPGTVDPDRLAEALAGLKSRPGGRK
jgi:DNA-binding NarL/FixJ family response regulator